MLKILNPLLCCLFLTSCKIFPNSFRNEVRRLDILELLDESSVRFRRTSANTGGDLSFKMKDRYNCRIQYWTDDLNEKPSPQSPMALDCPNDGKQTDIQFALEGLTPETSLNFKIIIWPRNVSFLSNFAYNFSEGGDLNKINTSNLIVSRYVVPRNSNEIYTYMFPNSTSVRDIKEKIQDELSKKIGLCVEGSTESQLPFPRNTSLEDTAKRPLHGLSKLSTDGFAQGVATVHPFFPTRLTQFFDDVDRQQNWKWSFDWEGNRQGFEIYPPGYIATISLTNGDSKTDIKDKLLGDAQIKIDSGAKPFILNPSILFLTDMASYQLVVKTSDASKVLLRCDYSPKENSLSIPPIYYEKIPLGEYIITLTLETSQLYAKEGSSTPPWLVTAQDWTSFKLIKRL